MKQVIISLCVIAIVLVILVILIYFMKSKYELKSMSNPLVEQRADPWVYLHSDGYYYFIATVPEYDRIELRRASSLQKLNSAKTKTIWKKHISGKMGSHIWAPEIHFIDGKWYVYFAAGGSVKIWNIRMYVLENGSTNPLEGEWTEKGQIKTFDETFSLDATTFEHKGVRYLVWAQKDMSIKGNTNLYIAEMLNPWTIMGEPVMLTKPEFDWEQHLFWVNEGPAVIVKNNKIFITYSASGTDYHYCMGLLTASIDSDLLNVASWQKSPKPVFESNDKTGIYGPGHSCFTTSKDKKTDILMYHARNYKEVEGDPLHDPNRHTRVQKILWKKDGTPNFGIPVKEK